MKNGKKRVLNCSVIGWMILELTIVIAIVFILIVIGIGLTALFNWINEAKPVVPLVSDLISATAIRA